MTTRMFASRVHIAVAVLAMLALTDRVQGEIVVIVHPQSGVEKLTAAEVADLYLGNRRTLADGRSAQVVDLPEASPLRDQFYSRVTGRNAAQLQSAWARLLFSGKAIPPRELPSTAAVKRFVTTHPNAIGYIEKSALDETVKAVFVVD